MTDINAVLLATNVIISGAFGFGAIRESRFPWEAIPNALIIVAILCFFN